LVWSFVCVAFCRLVRLVVLLCRSERSKELEILLLRHELAILRRRPRRARVRAENSIGVHWGASLVVGRLVWPCLAPVLESASRVATP
jgi:hypothetical protein